MFNILTLFNWTTWLLICLILFAIFWFIWGGKHTYEFVGVKPLQTPEIKYIQDDEIVEQNSYPVQMQYQNRYAEPGNVVPNALKQSKGEDIVAEVFQDIIQKQVQRNVRPDFLRNPETGKALELDCYDEEYKIAVEYNGIQHYKYPSAFHKSEKQFYDQVYRDRLKKKLCDEADVYLIPIPYWVDMCVPDPNNEEKLICSKFVTPQLRYQRIYDFLYDKLEEYFSIIFPTEENGDERDDGIAEDSSDRWSEYNYE